MENINTSTTTLNKSTQFLCEDCNASFCLLDYSPVCPNCGSKDLTHMVIIYQEYQPEKDEMYSKVDWRAGD